MVQDVEGQGASAAHARHDGEQAYYVYAVARPRSDREPAPLPSAGIVPDAPVYTLAHRDLLAVISPVPLAEFSSEALEDNLQDVDWTRERVVAHQQVLAALLDSYTLIPFKFCTLYASEGRVREVLGRHYTSLDEILSRLAGAIEWGVKLYYDPQRLVAWVQEHSEALRPQRERIAQASQGAAYLLRKKLEQAAQDEVERAVDTWVQVSHQQLTRSAREAVTNPVQSPQVHGRQTEMTFNAAYLVDEAELAGFRSALAELEATYADQGFEYELTGPWPPYNFAALKLEDPADEFRAVE